MVPLADPTFDSIGIVMQMTSPSSTCGGLISGSCVLIAPNMIVTSRHSVTAPNQPIPPDGSITHRVRFRRGVNGTGFTNFVHIECGNWMQESRILDLIDSPDPNVDLVIGILETPIRNITPMALDLTTAPTLGLPVTLVGWGYEGNCFGEGAHWQLRHSTGTIPITATGGKFFMNGCVGDGGPCLVCPPETPSVVANYHDSGAPLLIQAPCGEPGSGQTEYRVLGIVLNSRMCVRITEWNRTVPSPTLVGSQAGCVACRADFDKDGQVTIGDIFKFLGAWFAGSPWTDIDGTPGLGISDIFSFIALFFVGC